MLAALALEMAETPLAVERDFSNPIAWALATSMLMRMFSFGKPRIIDDLRSSDCSSKDTVVVEDIGFEVELRVNVFVPSLELADEDTVDDADVLCVLAEVLATPGELAVGAPDECIERDGRLNVGLFIRFLTLCKENALGNNKIATSVGDRHCASVLIDVNTQDA
jgi:hypothetical protein